MRVGNLPGVRRLPLYLNLIREFEAAGKETVSAAALAEEAGLVASVVKKDIEMTGVIGKTGVGYNIRELCCGIETYLGWNQPYSAILAGVGHLGSALLGYSGFRRYGLNFIAAFDSDPQKISTKIHDVTVYSIATVTDFIQKNNIVTAVLTVPSTAAQNVADQLVAGGIKRIWNFAPVILTVPKNIVVQREDLSAGLAEMLVRCRTLQL